MEFMKWATRPSAVQRETPIIYYMNDHGLKKFYSIPVDMQKSGYYVDKESYLICMTNVKDEVMKDPVKHVADYPRYSEKLIEKGKKIWENINGDKKKLWELYLDYCNFVEEYSVYFMGTWAAEEYIIPELARIYPDQIHMITSPGKLLEHQKMQIALLNQSPKEVQKEYKWMNVYSYIEDDYPVSYFEEIKKSIPKEDIKKMQLDVKRNQREFNSLLKTIKDVDTRNKLILVHEYAFIKTDRVEIWRKAMYYVREFFRKLSNEIKISMSEATNLTLDEIRDYLLTNKLPDRKTVRLRGVRKFITEIEGKKVRLIFDENEISKIKSNLEEEISTETEFIGVTASIGHVKGPARIITDKSQLSKIKSGDIIISTWTTPDFLTAMKLSAGIITEEGGLTSHAAVTSRELNKPCVMNIKNATKIIKDGDMIELDANKGTVRKL